MIFLTGPHAAGKTQMAALFRRYGFINIDLGPTLRQAHKKSRSKKSFAEWVAKGEVGHGKHFTDAVLVEKIRATVIELSQDRRCKLIIVGSRSWNGIHYICARLRDLDGVGDRVVIFLDAPPDTLYKRYSRREGKKIPRRDFEALLAEDQRLGVDAIRDRADYYVSNNKSIAELLKHVRKFVAVISQNRRTR